MQISREALLRMFGDAGGSGAGGGGGMNIAQMEAMLSGYATEDWVDKNYLSIDFFSSLFKAYDSNDNEITPNDGAVATIDNIKAMFGFWTNQYISALGRNSSGGGGGGDILTEPLSTINSSALGVPTGSNKVIMWNGSAWVYSTLTGNTGTVTSVGLAPSNGSHLAVSGSPITTSGTMYVSVESGYSIPTDVRQANWDAAYTNSHTHTNKSVLDGITSTQVTNWDDAVTALTALTTRVGTLEGYFTNGNANNALRLTTTSKTLWGNTYWTSGGVPKSVGTSSNYASLSYVTNINMAGTIIGARAIEMNTDGGLTSIGGHIDFHYNGGGSDFTSRIVENSAGVISVLARTNDSSNTLTDAGLEVGASYDGSYIRIGNVYLSYNETNNALVVSANADGTGAANIYAIGGVSALGYGASGGSGSVTALTDLVDVNISSPSNGQALVYDSTLGKWKNGAVTTGTVTSVELTMPIGFSVSGSPITSNGTFAVSFGGSIQANRVLASPNGSTGAPSWRSLVVGDIPDLSGTYATPASVATQMQNYAYISGSTIHIGSNSITPLTSHQTVNGTFWGQSWSNGSSIAGNLNAGSNGGVIYSFHGIEINSAGSLSNYGGYIDFHFNGSSSDFTSRIIEDASGRLQMNTQVYIPASKSLRIGDGLLTWDSTNNALKITKYDDSAANIYALGSVSALGFQSGGISPNSATFGSINVGQIDVSQGISVEDGARISTPDSLYIGNDESLGWVYMADMCSQADSSKWSITEDGTAKFSKLVRAPKFYLDNSRYLYLSSDSTPKLMYYNGTTSKEVAFV